MHTGNRPLQPTVNVQRSRRQLIAGAGALILLANVAPLRAASPFGSPRSAGDLLPVEQALRVGPALWQSGVLTLHAEAAAGCYLYRERFVVERLDGGEALQGLQLPAGERYADENFGDVAIWRGAVVLSYAAATAPARIRVRFQGCAEGRVCYAPQLRELPVQPLETAAP